MKRQKAGYSLVELLVVLAIIGIVSLVSVPNFMSMARTGRLKSSLRSVTSVLRSARERAVTRYRPVRVSFATGTADTARQYSMAEFNGTSWVTIVGPNKLEETCYFSNPSAVTVNVTDLDSDGLLDVVFRSNGTPQLPTSTTTSLRVFIKTDGKIPVTQYKIEVLPSGVVKAVGVNDDGTLKSGEKAF